MRVNTSSFDMFFQQRYLQAEIGPRHMMQGLFHLQYCKTLSQTRVCGIGYRLHLFQKMATKFHLSNGAELIAENMTTNNFEYDIEW